MSSVKGIKLLAHQKNAVDMFNHSKKGIVIYHTLGSGKTYTGIACAAQVKNAHVIFITPTSVLTQFNESIENYNFKNTYDIYSYEGFTSMLESSGYNERSVIVVDEAHRLRNTTGKMSSLILKYISRYAIKTVLMTGTPFVNHPWDIASLINSVGESEIKMPRGSKRFKLMFFSSNPNHPYNFAMKNSHVFKEMTLHCTSSYETSLFEPKVVYTDRRVEMNIEQARLHKDVEQRVLKNSNMKLLLLEEEDSKNRKKHLKSLNAFLSQTRQLSNLIKGKQTPTSPKLIAVTRAIISNTTYPVIVYSNFIEAGIDPFMEFFSSRYPHIEIDKFTGKLSKAAKDNIVRRYNKGKIQVLCISASGSEGLDFKKTRQVHIMEPHWNATRINQIIGRAIRYKSHSNLSKENRKVQVYKWYSVYPKDKKYQGYSADEILLRITNKKEYINNKFKKLFQKNRR